MSDERIFLFGHEPNPPEVTVLARNSMPRYPAESVRDRPEEALAGLEETDLFVVRFGAGAIGFPDFPVADVPQHGAVPTFHETLACLQTFVAHPKFAGMIITEFKPDHAADEVALAVAVVRGISRAFAKETPG